MVEELAGGDVGFAFDAQAGDDARGRGVEGEQAQVVGFHHAGEGADGFRHGGQVVDGGAVDLGAALGGVAVVAVDHYVASAGHEHLRAGEGSGRHGAAHYGVDAVGERGAHALGGGGGVAQARLGQVDAGSHGGYAAQGHGQATVYLDAAEDGLGGRAACGGKVVVDGDDGGGPGQRGAEFGHLVGVDEEHVHQGAASVETGKGLARGLRVGEDGGYYHVVVLYPRGDACRGVEDVDGGVFAAHGGEFGGGRARADVYHGYLARGYVAEGEDIAVVAQGGGRCVGQARDYGLGLGRGYAGRQAVEVDSRGLGADKHVFVSQHLAACGFDGGGLDFAGFHGGEDGVDVGGGVAARQEHLGSGLDGGHAGVLAFDTRSFHLQGVGVDKAAEAHFIF